MNRRSRRAAPGEPDVARWRLATLSAVWIVAFGLLAGRMVDLQVVRAGALARLAVRQQLESLRLPGRRGQIVDRAGRPLAINVEVDS
ncbi:MAG TPA: peptidoglycan glycosyltransferase, partial [bacterium]|nr:peptidoglycan glycosyltransferase [bacterium]